MLISKKSLLTLLYLCIAFFVMLFSVSIISQILGYWIGGGEYMLVYLKDNFYKVLNTGLVGVGVGCAYWFFYYRKI